MYPLKSNANCTATKIYFFPLIFDLLRVKAAIVATNTYNHVDTTETNKLLKIYLKSGTLRLDKRLGKTRKFSNVGLVTQNFGGKTRSSSNGLNEVTIQ